MRRREFNILVVSAGLAWSCHAFAQSTGRITRVALLSNLSPSASDPRQMAALKEGLHENGLIEGTNVEVEYFWAEASFDRMQGLAMKLGQGNFDIILTAGSKAVKTLRATGTKTPIVFTVAADPVGSGIVESLARPGGNVTGLSMSDNNLESKRIELLKETVPSISKVMILRDPVVGVPTGVAEAQAAARALSLDVVVAEAASSDEVEAAFRRGRDQGVDAVAAMASASSTSSASA
ncbi:ABC-type uncharacterized transport system substrate-binding protein [Bradyrhizobium sp. CIR48]|uniref:ABC transporter substrate-binding protein n=1 Tax=Bradyrhizobium sp. CIR48 TaxID=2663840 RepID=UPI001606386B|nr:ABC transporter substrate-binding protein [Bradyrhizobium sp. CIR48]MBB4429865.1 ABC-type uncharacterized transport system substrate-binding protein [Bradyrhizobium sp. CIR48]